MKKVLQKIKYINEVFFIKVTIILLVLCVGLLLAFNQYAISFWINGFSKFVNNPFQVYFLDVGQASATFLVLPNGQTMLIDTGTEESSSALVKSLNWILRKNHLSGVDILVLTHSDADHVGGAMAVLKNFEVRLAFRPKLLSFDEASLENNFPIVYTNTYNMALKSLYSEPNCQIEFTENLHMQMEAECYIDFYACENETNTETNYHSPFIVMEFKGNTFMFTGDATAAREKEFLNMMEKYQLEMNVDFLQVAHHGSKYSSTQDFLNAISPKYAFVSAGDSTHPTPQVLERLENAGAEDIFVTKEVGTIGVGIDMEGNYVVLTSTKFVDIPCLVVIFSLAGFILMFYVEKKDCRRNVRFFDK